ncbi:MAG: hypothetical protein GTO30_08320, partial [Acidobacteria bacterium]|nr:hypothetical protein [Acidobacteriota bacterium]NIQ86297.1 hypothetical protein [Acidobacteriota bacterium]
MPLFGVPRDTGEYPVIPAEYLLNIEDTRRAASGNYNRGSWQFETATYACIEYGWEEPVDDKAANMYRTYFDAEMVSTEIATDVLLRGHEKRVADTLFNTSNAIGNAAVTTEWSTITATPKADVNSGIQAMRAASGIMPNALVMSRKVFENVLVTTELKDYLQYTTPHLVEGEEAQRATLARYFGVERVLVGGAVQNTAKEGQAFAAGDLWDDEYVSLCRLSGGGNNLREPVFGRTFLWEEDAPDVIVTETYR